MKTAAVFFVAVMVPALAAEAGPAMMYSPPAQIARSPRAAQAAGAAGAAMIAPGSALLLSAAGNANLFSVQARNAYGGAWITLGSNYAGSVAIPLSVLAQFTNPIVYVQSLGWTAYTNGPIGGFFAYCGPAAGAYTNRLKIPDPEATNCTIAGLAPRPTFYALTAYNAGSLESPFSTSVSGTPTARQAPIALWLRIVQPRGPAATVTLRGL